MLEYCKFYVQFMRVSLARRVLQYATAHPGILSTDQERQRCARNELAVSAVYYAMQQNPLRTSRIRGIPQLLALVDGEGILARAPAPQREAGARMAALLDALERTFQNETLSNAERCMLDIREYHSVTLQEILPLTA